MMKLVLSMAASLAMVGAAAAADLPRAQPAPVAPGPVGKAPIGKYPVGKTPIGKTPIGKTPVAAPAPSPVIRKG
jgi:hypothetical protein